MAAIASKFYYVCAIQYYSDQCEGHTHLAGHVENMGEECTSCYASCKLPCNGSYIAGSYILRNKFYICGEVLY